MTGGKYPSLFTLHERHHVLLSVGCKARQAEKMAAVLVMLVHGRWLFIPAQKIAVTPLPLSGMHSVLTADLIFYRLHYPSVLLFYHSVCHFEQIIKFYKKKLLKNCCYIAVEQAADAVIACMLPLVWKIGRPGKLREFDSCQGLVG